MSVQAITTNSKIDSSSHIFRGISFRKDIYHYPSRVKFVVETIRSISIQLFPTPSIDRGHGLDTMATIVSLNSLAAIGSSSIGWQSPQSTV